jgi:hypothetical protein
MSWQSIAVVLEDIKVKIVAGLSLVVGRRKTKNARKDIMETQDTSRYQRIPGNSPEGTYVQYIP